MDNWKFDKTTFLLGRPKLSDQEAHDNSKEWLHYGLQAYIACQIYANAPVRIPRVAGGSLDHPKGILSMNHFSHHCKTNKQTTKQITITITQLPAFQKFMILSTEIHTSYSEFIILIHPIEKPRFIDTLPVPRGSEPKARFHPGSWWHVPHVPDVQALVLCVWHGKYQQFSQGLRWWYHRMFVPFTFHSFGKRSLKDL